MEFRPVFVLWLHVLVLVPCALGATKRFKRDAMDTTNQNANQTIQEWLMEVKSDLSAEQQNRLNIIRSSNPKFVRELLELMQKHAGDPNGEKLKPAAKALFETYLNVDARQQEWLMEVKSDLSAEQQNRLNIIRSSNPKFVRELSELMQKHAGDPNGDKLKPAAKALFETYLNVDARQQEWLMEVKSDLSAEQQNRLNIIRSSNPEFVRELSELMQKHAGDTNGDKLKLAAKALFETYLNVDARQQSTTPDIPDISNIPNIPDIPDTPAIPDIPDISDAPAIPDTPDISDSPDWVQEIASGFSAEQQRRLMTIASSNPNFLREYGELQQKYGTDTDEFKQAVKALAERYVNGGAGLVVSLVALVASLFVQGLVMFG